MDPIFKTYKYNYDENNKHSFSPNYGKNWKIFGCFLAMKLKFKSHEQI